jgi:threonyl-tRNA synthetase
MQLWETSGHAANYKENMFVFEVALFLKVRAFESNELVYLKTSSV